MAHLDKLQPVVRMQGQDGNEGDCHALSLRECLVGDGHRCIESEPLKIAQGMAMGGHSPTYEVGVIRRNDNHWCVVPGSLLPTCNAQSRG